MDRKQLARAVDINRELAEKGSVARGHKAEANDERQQQQRQEAHFAAFLASEGRQLAASAYLSRRFLKKTFFLQQRPTQLGRESMHLQRHQQPAAKRPARILVKTALQRSRSPKELHIAAVTLGPPRRKPKPRPLPALP